jgi:N-sulfoglucosamine sulfohydrolase
MCKIVSTYRQMTQLTRHQKDALWCFIMGIIVLSGSSCESFQREPLPNILLIVSEDHSAHLSCYGDTVISTPNLDAIAGEGLLFANAYVTQAVCSPSRSSILTGLYPHQNGHLGLATHGYRLVGDTPNVYELLKAKGYRTGMIGKLHLNPAEQFPIDYHPIKGSNFEKRGLSRYAAHADTFMRASDEPFFLMVNFPDAHYPFQDVVEGRPADPLSPDEVAVFPYIGFENERIRKITTNYYNCLQRLDESVGELMQALGASGKKRNTLVIYLSDHGDEMARGKFDIYEVGIRIPFLASWPGRIEPGTRSDALISTIDIVPTLLNVAGVAQTKGMTGQSLLPLFKNPKADFREYLFAEYNCDPVLYYPRRSVRDNRYKLIYTLLEDRENPTANFYIANSTPAYEGSPTFAELATAPDSIQALYREWVNPPKVQLYDLLADPWEFRDLSKDPRYHEVADRLLTSLKRWQEESGDPMRDPDKLRRLTIEHDGLDGWKKKNDWDYPEYLYGESITAGVAP